MKKIMKLLLSTVMVLSSIMAISVQAEDAAAPISNIPDDQIIKNDATGIPDKNLYAGMLEPGDTNKDGILTKDEAKLISGIWFSSEKNLDLSGIEMATNLKNINITGNTLYGEEKPIIQNMVKLEGLKGILEIRVRGFNGIDTNVLSKMTSLSSLRIDGCYLPNLSWISNLTNLSYLTLLIDNAVDLSPISKLINLTTLNIQPLGNVDPGLDISNLNFESLIKLEELSLRGMTTIGNLVSVGELHNLTKLEISSFGGRLNSLDVMQNLTKLTHLGITGIDIGNISAISKLIGLTSLELGACKLKDVDISCISSLVNLNTLSLASNDLEQLPNLKSLVNLDFSAAMLGSVKMGGNRLTEEELLKKLPDKVKNFPKWLEYNKVVPRMEEIHVNTDSDLPTAKIIELLKGDPEFISGVHIEAKTLSKLPKEIIKVMIENNKVVTILNQSESAYWWLTPDEVKNIEGDLDLGFARNSQYEKEIKELTKIDELLFLTFKTNETFKEGTIDIGFDDVFDFYPAGDIHVYSYNPITKAIKIAGTGSGAGGSDDGWGFGVTFGLEKNANTIFVSKKGGLENIKGEPNQPETPEMTPSNKVINGDNISITDIVASLQDEKISTITVNIKNSDTVTSDLLNSIKASGKTVTFNILNDDNKLKYSWSFNGKSMNDTAGMDIDLNIDFRSDKQKEIEKITNQKDMFYLQFAYHGKLPSPTTMKVDVSSQYKNGEYIYLYYFNEEKGTIDKASSGIEVIDGYAEFVITHCSTYFFAKENLKSASSPSTSDNSNIALISMWMGASILGIYLLRKKKLN